jgi:alpha-L-fucosidase
MKITRRELLKQGTLTAASLKSPALFGLGGAQLADTLPGTGGERKIASGPFQPTWESLKSYQAPEWFRDAKFGIWAHWTAQCIPEDGDWYARNMYIQGDAQYNHHLSHYGHPSKTGFMEIDHLWKADRWQPDELMQLYVKAGAKYFMGLASHHDNFDCFDSRYHAWNSTRAGPGKDIVGTWARIAREHGLRFAVSNHSAHAWHWFQTAYGYDAEGPLAGIRYDAFRLSKEDGKGKWWEGLDPQELYTGPNMVMPDGLKTISEVQQWHQGHDRKWTEEPPANNPEFVKTWYLRCQDLLDRYKPDMLYFDDYELPLGQAGLDITAHFYNSNLQWHGKLDAVVTAKNFKPEHIGATILDIERGRANSILPAPWQTDTCIGDWHYDRSIFEEHRYKTARSVVQTLVDIVSKNGNLMLNIPLRGDGTIDEDEHKFLNDLSSWMQVNGEAIYGTRPFRIYGEGLPDVEASADFNESKARPFTAEDIRFTTKGDTLYAFALGWPEDGKLTIKTLALDGNEYKNPIHRVTLLGSAGTLRFTRDKSGLTITLPPEKPNDYAYAFRIS